MAELSVIIPSLNVSSFIMECIDSVICKQLRDIEILVIDANSTDGTTEKVKKYQKKDSRVKLILSDVRSYGYQMNLGLKAATGKYVFVLESDDAVVDGALPLLLDVIKNNPEIDFVKGYPICFYKLSNGSCFDVSVARVGKEKNILGKIISPSVMPELLFEDIFFWLGLYRKSFLDNIFFNETPGAAFQDQGFLLQTLSSAGKAMYVDVPVYRYRQNNPGSSIYNPKGFLYIFQEYGLNERFLQNLSSEWKHFFYLRMLQQTMARFQVMGLSGKFWEDAIGALQKIKVRLNDAIEEGLLHVNRFNEEQGKFWKAFQEDIRKPFFYFDDQYTEKKRQFAVIADWARDYDVVIYGAGNWGRFIQAFLLVHHIGDLKCFADQSEVLQGIKVQGMLVRSPEEALSLYADAYYLIANSRHRDEICDYLMRKGVPEEHILSPQITIDTMMFLADFSRREG